MIADLHTHSTASDGQYSPAQLVRMASEAGIRLLALTDHDTVSGAEEAEQAGRSMGIRVLRGVELSAREYPGLHILGYGFVSGPSGLTDLCRELRAGREQRKYRIADYLREKGLEVPLEEVEALAPGGVVGRPHFAQVMVRHGYVQTAREAFQQYLDTEDFQRIERFKATARTCVEVIKASGGKVSLAHPYQTELGEEDLEALVKRLKDYGLDAIECYYPRYTPEQTALYLRLVKKYGLHITGGSDFHGERVKPDIRLARWDLDASWLLS